jgi:enoyl-CoA hydratase/carnithine racemase
VHAAGLINRLAEDAGDLATVEADFVDKLAALDPLAVKLTRDTFRAAETMPLDNALDMGRQLNQMLAALGRFQAASSKV